MSTGSSLLLGGVKGYLVIRGTITKVWFNNQLPVTKILVFTLQLANKITLKLIGNSDMFIYSHIIA